MSSFFCPNVGPMDRAIRIGVGIGLLSLAFVGPQTPWGFIGLIPLATGALGWCGAYSLLGLRTKGPCCSSSGEGEKSGCCGGGSCGSKKD